MSTFNFDLTFLALMISVIFRLCAAFMYGFVAIQAYRETGVKNGLIGLRRQLFASCSILFVINIFGMILAIGRFAADGMLFQTISNTLSVVNSMGFFFVAYLFIKIYTQSYSTSSKAHHARISVMEKSFKKTQIRNSKKRKAVK